MKTILYIHGMGGGRDSRIPSILNEWFGAHGTDVRVVVRTYDFHPDRAGEQIDAWYEQLRPELVIGESMGAVHALALLTQKSKAAGAGSAAPAFPLLLVSPALNGPVYFYRLRALTRIPGIRRLFNRIYKPREGERQAIDFRYANMAAWPRHRDDALSAASLIPKDDSRGGQAAQAQKPARIHAFFGRRDHYRRSGVVSIRQWRKCFGPGSYTLYDGSHYMEEEHLTALLIPAILERI